MTDFVDPCKAVPALQQQVPDAVLQLRHVDEASLLPAPKLVNLCQFAASGPSTWALANPEVPAKQHRGADLDLDKLAREFGVEGAVMLTGRPAAAAFARDWTGRAVTAAVLKVETILQDLGATNGYEAWSTRAKAMVRNPFDLEFNPTTAAQATQRVIKQYQTLTGDILRTYRDKLSSVGEAEWEAIKAQRNRLTGAIRELHQKILRDIEAHTKQPPNPSNASGPGHSP